MNIGNIIKTLRKEVGLNQTDFALKCGITQASLSQIETGATRPNKGTIKKICKAFDLPEAMLYVLSIEEDDVPERKREAYRILFPTIKAALLQLISEKENV